MVVNSSVTPHNRLSGYIERGQLHYMFTTQSDHVHRPEKRKIKRQRIEGLREYLLRERVRQKKCHIEPKRFHYFHRKIPYTLQQLMAAGGYVCVDQGIMGFG